ncbi:hypothetical protein Esi_0003_0165 [Ectocarpus siliculosus]|uniref:Uncharacterized protein n=1 Tax=Ectocarpus siliculosus TaxID=2880 RepID=D7FW09_ECTSI|nr:hypothetical protein Esi_0003_0165 [Ectocarpus siliculosus]|eukprot:CBJ25529.1 hypothetical protein Esi_0003_0165 [Ectocarpus siliculosus]
MLTFFTRERFAVLYVACFIFRQITAHLAYYLGLYDEAEASIERALELGHEEDGSMQLRLARMHVRREKADSANAERHLRSALASYSEAMKFVRVASEAVHYLEVTSVYLKLNETQRAANALSTVLVRWPALLVDAENDGHGSVPVIEGDRAEVDLPVASNVLGGESIFLQMGFCFETLRQDKMAAEAYRQAWNTLLEQRHASAAPAGYGAVFAKTAKSGGGKEVGVVGVDEIGAILRQAQLALAASSRSTSAAGGRSRDSTPEQQLQRSKGTSSTERRPPSSGQQPDQQGVGGGRGGVPSSLPSTADSSCLGRGGGRGDHGDSSCGVTKKETVVDAAKARALGFELWCKNPYTWFSFGEVVLEGGCYALTLAFLAKAVALLPSGLHQQEKGRFGDAHSAAEEARDLDPFGKAVRLLCPRLMALHSVDARCQYTRESQSALRVQRAWRGHRVIRVLHDLVSKQTAALRIQRFMREWRKHGFILALRLVATSALELSKLGAKYTKAMGLAAQAAAADRLQALTASAEAVQRAARVLIAHRRVSRRKEAIAALQAFCRGCRLRWALSAAFEESLRLEYVAHDLRQQRDCGDGGREEGAYTCEEGVEPGPDREGVGNTDREGKRGPSAAPLRPRHGDGCKPHKEEAFAGYNAPLNVQLGVIARRNFPMDAGCAKGFRPPNLAAFLWESREEAYGSCCADDGTDDNPTLLVPHLGNETESPRSYVDSAARSSHGDDGAVFEASATAVASSACREDPVRMGSEQNEVDLGDCSPDQHGGGRPPAFDELPASPVSPLPLLQPPRWVPATVAPEGAFHRALACSTLIVNSPSFDSSSARRLFSRMGKPIPAASPPRDEPQQEADDVKGMAAGVRRGKADLNPTHGEEKEKRRLKKHPGCLHANGLKHVLLVGESPIGDGGLSELSSAVRCGWLPRLTTLVIGGPGCKVGPRGVAALATALSTSGCSQLQHLSMSNCCLGRQKQRRRRHHHGCKTSLLNPASVSAEKAAAEAHAAWDCFFRHLQRLPSLATLSIQDAGLENRDVRSLSIALQILPADRLRCLRLNGNCVGESGLRMLLTALTSRRRRLPALWLRRQRPALVESGARDIFEGAFRDGLFAEVEFERPFEVMGGRSHLALIECTTETEDLGRRALKHPTSHIYI